MARMVGEQGLVHAVDLQHSMIEETRVRLDGAEVADRVRLHHCGAYNLPLADNSCDLAIMIATLSQIPDRPAALFELRRILKPGACLAISEELPDPAYLPSQMIQRWAEETGFILQGKTGSIFCYSMTFVNDKELFGEIID
jgi:ubiquinone/menaquinone biosynthesis C-methylase UbiE